MDLEYAGQLVVVALHNTLPGFEVEVQHQVDRHLMNARGQRAKVVHELAQARLQDGVGTFEPAYEAGSDVRDSLFAKHFSLFGHFDLASIFEAHEFDICPQLGDVTCVTSQQFIVGGRPLLDTSREEYSVFALNSERESLGRSEWLPLVAVCQLQIDGLVSAFAGSHLMMPALAVIGRTLHEIARGENTELRCLCVDSFGWSDWTLVLTADNYEVLLKAIYSLRALTLSEICEGIEMLDSEGRTSFLRESLEGISDLLPDGKLGEQPVWEFLGPQEGLSTSFTMLGCDLKVTKELLGQEARSRALPEGAEPGVEQSDCGIRGCISADVKLTVKPGREWWVQQTVAEVARADSDITRLAVGKADVLVHSRDLCQASGKGHVSTAQFLRVLYYLRWRLIGEPQVVERPWHERCWSRKDDPLAESLLVECCTELESKRLAPPMEDGGRRIATVFRETMRESRSYEEQRKSIRELSDRMRSRKIGNSLGESLFGSLAQWHNATQDHYLVSRMLELEDSVDVANRCASVMIANKDAYSRLDIESFLESFASHFAQSFNHRLQTSYHLCDRAVALTEYKVGLAHFLSTLDGFVKGLSAVAGDSRDVALLTNLSRDTSARIKVGLAEGSDPSQRVAHGVVIFNRSLLLHPGNLRTLIHELAHLVVLSSTFQKPLTRERLHEAVREYGNEDSEQGLVQERLREIATEIVAARLCFADDLDLYCNVMLPCFALDVQGQGLHRRENAIQAVEHISRTFVVYWVSGQNVHAPRMADVETWWVRHSDLIPARGEKYVRVLKKACCSRVLEWFERDGEEFRELRIAADAVVEQEALAEFRRCRSILLSESIRQEIRSKLAQGRPVGIDSVLIRAEGGVGVLGDRKEWSDDPIHELRQRRLVALAGHLALLRAFLEELDTWIEEGEGECRFARRNEEDGSIDFSEVRQEVLYDFVYGAVFVVGEQRSTDYIRLRLAFIKSMWHLSEITKQFELLTSLHRKPVEQLAHD